ncbi:MAG: histidine kinase [Bacteroidetes bacterium]|nr:histidine kinase [Bacteroidota bacterium]
MIANASYKFFVLLLFQLLAFSVFCQEYNYVHYDVKDGLAGSTVYAIVQDRDGFLWFGTETGLSRFDGTHFKNFYTNDGLPDNEIVNLFVDSKNRIWITPFRNSICYYWKGKIHNNQNDSLLKQINITSEIVYVAENGKGDIIITERYNVYIIKANGQMINISNFEGYPFDVSSVDRALYKNFEIVLIKKTKDEKDHTRFIVKVNETTSNSLIKLDDQLPDKDELVYKSPQLKILLHQNRLYITYKERDPGETTINLSHGLIKISDVNDSVISFNTVDEAYAYNIKARKITDTFVLHQAINSVTQDTEDNLWFSTMGKGVYRLPPGGLINYSSKEQAKSVFCIQKNDSIIYAGSDNFYLWKINSANRTINSSKIWSGSTRGRITSIRIKNHGQNIIAGTDNGLFFLHENRIRDSLLFYSVKSIYPYGTDSLLVSTAQSVFSISTTTKISPLNLNLIWPDRSTCSYKKNQFIYVGTINGLHKINTTTNKKIYLGDSIKALHNRINGIAESNDSIIWIATNGAGLVGYKNDRLVSNITEKDGLTSNICRNIFISSNVIWVGTDKGLNKISIIDGRYNIVQFTSADGLNSDIINALYVDSNEVYAGTPEGLSYFDYTKIFKKSICNLLITGITVSGIHKPADSNDFILKHSDNNIIFQYIGISYKSAGKIVYEYRMLGLDTTWKRTTDLSLNYPSLSSGNYELQLKAINKFGVQSNLVSVHFSISKLVWELNWFRALLFLLCSYIIWHLVNNRIRVIQKREKDRSDTITKIAELEQMALKSQMNPHFIFNCLNSIQHYVIDRDILGANDFISKFSRLIRSTLDNSSKPTINLEDEIDYLVIYMELEQRRFENKFSFKIITENINKQEYYIPPMILQPYVENAIRHGVRYRNDDKGEIIIKIIKDQHTLSVNISDNGIGRRLSHEYKSKIPIEYQSKGMELTAKRIEMFNKTHSPAIKILINDLENELHEGLGTEVIISFPLEHTFKFYSKT